MTSYFINLLFINEPQCLESSLHTLLVATSGKPPASFQVVKKNLCLKGMQVVVMSQSIWGCNVCQGAKRPSPRERSDRAGEGCGRGGGGGGVSPLPRYGAFFSFFRLQNVQSEAYLRRKFGLDDMYMGELVWN